MARDHFFSLQHLGPFMLGDKVREAGTARARGGGGGSGGAIRRLRLGLGLGLGRTAKRGAGSEGGRIDRLIDIEQLFAEKEAERAV